MSIQSATSQALKLQTHPLVRCMASGTILYNLQSSMKLGMYLAILSPFRGWQTTATLWTVDKHCVKG